MEAGVGGFRSRGRFGGCAWAHHYVGVAAQSMRVSAGFGGEKKMRPFGLEERRLRNAWR